MKETLGNRIAELRKTRRMTQTDLANELNMSHSTVAMWETGKRDPDTKMLGVLADFFNVSTDYLLGITNVNQVDESNIDDDVRILARDIQDLDSGKRELLKGFIDAMRETGREAKKKK